jgi:molybdate transport system substrate-binding protein
MKRVSLLLLILIVLLSACAAKPAAPNQTVTVFAAASLTDAFTEMASAFEAAYPGSSVTLNFAGSNTLRSQIEEGAPADVFASANLKEMNTLVEKGLVDSQAQKTFLTNRLVVLLPEGNPAQVQELSDLARPGLKLVLAAEEVPAGRYARQMLEKLDALYGSGYLQAALNNVVSNEDTVKKVVAKVQLGEADAGIVYTSDAVAAPSLPTLEIPPTYNVIAEYPIASPKQAPNPELAAQFIKFVLSPDGQAILKKWGFTPLAESTSLAPPLTAEELG